MGQCRSLKEWLVQKYYKSLKLGLPELPVSDVLGWNKQGVNHPTPQFGLHGTPYKCNSCFHASNYTRKSVYTIVSPPQGRATSSLGASIF
jgi:hypothetical protein